MARKKSETSQGDGVPEPKDEAAGIVASEDGGAPGAIPSPDPEALPASETHPESRPEPWDPGILAPESASSDPPEERPAGEPLAGTGFDAEPDPSRIEADPLPDALADPMPGSPSDPVPDLTTDPVPDLTTDPLADPVAATDERAAATAPPPAPDPVPVVEEHHEETHEEEGGRSLAGRALAVLCLLLLGAGLGIWAAPKIAPHLPSGMAPVAKWLTPGQVEAEAQVAALQERIDTGLGSVETRLAALPAGDDVDARIGTAVAAAEARLTAEIAAAREAAPTADLTAVNQQLGQLDAALAGQTTELTALKEQIAGTAGQLSEEALGRIDAYRGEVEALRGEMGAVRDAVSAFGTRIDDVEARASREVEAAQAQVDEIQQQAATELDAAGVSADIARIRAAVAAGQPFQQPLATFEQTGATPPAGLAASAESGVATLSALRESYPDAAHAAIRASVMASAGDGVLARSRAFLEAQVSSRSLTPQAGQGTDAVLSRMEDKLRQDDLDGVLAEAAALPSEAAAAMGDWLAAAKARAAALDGLATLDASLNKTN